MDPHRPQTARVHSALLRKLFVLERSGQFDLALEELREVWDDTTGPPNVDGLDPRTTAETYLRCGAIIGFLGHIRQIPTAQDRSKNLLTESRSLFLEIYDPEKIAECENYLALAYWRSGETNEAKSWIEEAQSHELPETSPTRLYSHVIRNLVLLSQRRFDEICSSFPSLEHTFLENADDFLVGNLYMNFGVASKNLGDIPRALESLLLARNYSERSGNKIQVAIAENNLSQLHKSERRFGKAHAAIDHATELFREIKDRTREGFSLDTKALIYFDEGKYDEALATVERALAILGKSENYGYLTDTIATKAKIQLYSNDFSTATLTLLEAVELAKVNISEEAALNLIAEFEQTLKQRSSSSGPGPELEQTGLASGDLKLSLPPSIAHYDGYQGVWINNSDLEAFGLACGSLAVVVPCPVRRGDLVAVIELENDLVSCGFYDSDFGIVCIEVAGSEPQLFSEGDIKVLGRIVGVCNVKPGSDETLNVQPLTL
jgi:tetratricopeptide (TPR) repeat protein